MASPDTEKMIRMVEERTGYGVSTTISADLMSWGGMVSASERNPKHLADGKKRGRRNRGSGIDLSVQW